MQLLPLQLLDRRVEIELDDPEWLADLAARTSRFTCSDGAETWLNLRLTRQYGTRDDRFPPRAHRPTPDELHFASPRAAGVAHLTPPYSVAGEIIDLIELYRLLYLCFAAVLPRENMLLLHADTVRWGTTAVAFLGPSGTGKSTAATHLAAHATGQYLAFDKTVVRLDRDGGQPVVQTMPNLMDQERNPGQSEIVPLGGLIYPRAGQGLTWAALEPVKAYQQLIQSILVPPGGGYGGDAAGLAAQVLEDTWSVELQYELGVDFSRYLESSRREL